MPTPNSLVLDWLNSYKGDLKAIAELDKNPEVAPIASIGNYSTPIKRPHTLYVISYLTAVEKYNADAPNMATSTNFYEVRCMIHVGYYVNDQSTNWEVIDTASWFIINHLEVPLQYGTTPAAEDGFLLGGRLGVGPTFITANAENVSNRERDQLDTLNRTQIEAIFFAPSEKKRYASQS